MFGGENGEGNVSCCLDLLGMPPGVGAGARSYCLGFGTKLGHRDSRQREIKRQLKENFSDLCFCLMLCPVLSFGGLIWDFWRKGDWRGKDSATLNKDTLKSSQIFFIVKNLTDVDCRDSISYACNILGDLLQAKNQYIL